jgi:excisionase family DNA binding protein
MAFQSLFTVEQAAQELLCKPRTLRYYVKTKQLAHLRLGRRLYFSEKDISAFIDSRRVEVNRGKP